MLLFSFRLILNVKASFNFLLISLIISFSLFPMESLKQASSSGFCYHQGFSGVLQVFVHNARNIHNICIYDNQDVYAKFSLTYNPDETISTRIIHRAGKNPEFNQRLMIDVTQIDAHAAVLKCEIWMMSRARHYMEDQLLGFALVPISDIIGQDSVTQDYSLSSTDLFHSPAGTVKLTLSIVNPSSSSSSSSSNPKINTTSISSEVVLLDPQVSETVDYTRIEFPDMNVVNENKQMVTEYFNGSGSASFLCLGSTHGPETDITMMCSEEKELYGNGSFMASSSTTTSLSDDKNTADSNEKENREITEVSRRRRSSGGEEEEEKKVNEETTMQKQIAEMYMRSMQQFTESLAKMKLPMDLHINPHEEDQSNNNNTTTQIHQNRNNNPNNNNSNNNGMEKKKEGSRVFYGSRAFF